MSPGRAPSRLLIRAPNWLGDVVLSLPAVRDLRAAFPGARLTVLARPRVADVYRAVAEVDAVRPSAGFRADRAALSGEFDLAVLLPNSFGSALLVFSAGVPERWGYATDGRGLLLTRRAPVPPEVRGRSQVYYYRAMLAAFGLDVSSPPDASLRCPPEWRLSADRWLDPARTWIGLSPGAAYGVAKRWIPERFAALGDRLAARYEAGLAVVGGADERELAEAIAAQMRAPVRVLCGQTTLPDLMGVLSGLRLLVTNDSGPMHLAAALGVPVLAVFGPTDWRETAPVGRHRLVRRDVSCAPCGFRECPIDHRCMRGVNSDEVAEAAAALLG